MKARPRLTRLLGAVLASAAAFEMGDPSLWALAADEARERRITSSGSAVVRALEAALIMSGQEGGAIRMAAIAMTPGEPEKESTVDILIEIDGTGLSSNPTKDLFAVDVYFYALDADQGVAASESRRFEIDIPTWGDTLDSSGLKIPARLSLDPGDYTLRILVRAESKQFGIRSLELTVPGSPAENQQVLQPFFRQPDGAWVVGDSTDSEPDTAGRFATLSVATESLVPAVLPVLSQSRQTRGYLFVRADIEETPTELTLALRSNTSDAVRTYAVPVLDRQHCSIDGYDALIFETVLDGALSGLHTALISYSLPDGSSLSSPPSVLAVAPEDASLVWTELDLDAYPNSGDPTIAARPFEAHPGDHSVAEIASTADLADLESQYRAALELFANGHTAAALNRVIEIESGDQVSSRPSWLRQIEELEWATIRSIGEQDWSSTAPLLVLQSELSRSYRDKRDRFSVDHAERLTGRLAREFAKNVGSPESRWLAAVTMARLAAAAQVTENLHQAIALFSESLSYQSDLEASLLGLAATYEKLGRSADAVQVLDRLLRLDPEHPEGRLRLAVNLGRQSKQQRAMEILEDLSSRESATWVRTVAQQEFIRLVTRRQGYRSAQEYAAEIRSTSSQSHTIEVQHAFLLDSLGRPSEARLILMDLETAPRDGLDSPRWTYNLWPRSELAADWQTAKSIADQHLPELSRILRTGDESTTTP